MDDPKRRRLLPLDSFSRFGRGFCRAASLLTIVAWGVAIGVPGICLAVEAAADAVAVGQPVRLEVYPDRVKLAGTRERQQLAVTAYYADGTLQDLTCAARFQSSDEQVAQIVGSVVVPRGNGTAEITVSAGDQSVKIPLEVTGQEDPQSVSFLYDAQAALSKQGCNSGACHGSPAGKGGFRLSLRGFDSELDRRTLTREELGRRTNPLAAEESLLLAKPLMRVSHGGGQRLRKSDPAYAVLRDWIAQGCQFDAAGAAACVGLDIYPPSGRLYQWPAHAQQLAVRARFADGTLRDVTRLAVFDSSDEDVATVTTGGQVAGRDRGEAAIVVRYLQYIQPVFFTFVKDIDGFAWSDPPANNFIDTLVYEQLRRLKFLPSELTTDAEFIRRVHLDLTGALPPVELARSFLASTAGDKRERLIDELLTRLECAQFWALKWGDLLRLSRKQVGDTGVYKYHRWLNQALAGNMPYDQFARELLTAAGSTLVNPQANYYRTASDVNDALETTAQIFLGSRIQCAKCHNHPFESWTQDNYYGMASFFNGVHRKKTARTEELIVWTAASGNVTQPRTGRAMAPWAPGLGDVKVSDDVDRRQAFVDWLVRPDNPFFAKVEANRIWAQVMGRGLVEPFDDFRETNPPSNAPLLEALARHFREHHFDRRELLKTILNSRTYQASSRTNAFNVTDKKYGSHYLPRMLSAEQLLDALGDVLAVGERFSGVASDTKATQLPSPDVTDNDFMKVFGQPERQTACQCERSSDSNLGQALQLFNGPLVHRKLTDDKNRIHRLVVAQKTDAEIVTELYLAAFCRVPSGEEMEATRQYIAAQTNRDRALEDIAWAILNTDEFLFQH